MSATPDPSRPAPAPAASSAVSGPRELEPLPLDVHSPQLTLRAALTGMVLGGLLSTCNVYAGLQIGWGFNMSITAALLGFGFWQLMHVSLRRPRFGLLESNINMTAASSAAAVSSAGLVAPIPALTMLTGQTLSPPALMLWVFSVCMVGIAVGIGLRRQMIIVDKLPFAAGLATAVTLREMYAEGTEALKRVTLLAGAAVLAVPLKLATAYHLPLLPAKMPSTLAPDVRVQGFTLGSLTFGLNSTLMMYGVGGLVGIRACTSMVLGGVLAWGVFAPWLTRAGYLRLEVRQPLAAVPAGVTLPPEPEGYARFDDARRTLQWKGVMTPAERDALLAQSDDPEWRVVIQRLYVASQLEFTAPLAALPNDVAFGPGGPVSYDPRRRVLHTRAVPDPAALEALHRLSDDPAYRAALAALAAGFRYESLCPVQVSVALPAWPERLTLPRTVAGSLRYDPVAGRLALTEPLSSAQQAQLDNWLNAYTAQRSSEAERVALVRAAVADLQRRIDAPRLPADFAVPTALAERVSWDAARQRLIAVGPLSAAEARQLKAALPETDAAFTDYSASVDALVRASRLTRVEPGFRDLVTWLLWPGVTAMVIASLVSFAFSWRSMLSAFGGGKRDAAAAAEPDAHEVSRRWFLFAVVSSLGLSVVLQVILFDIQAWAAVLGILLTFVLAVVAGRVSGETNITPVGAMGKVTQLLFGVLSPGRPEPNLMAANVTGGAASQCADLLHDLKTGYLVGASPRKQVIAQTLGALAGSVVGSLAYLVLIPDPREMLITEAWAAPAVAAWKAVAEIFAVGLAALPAGTPVAMLIAGILAAALAVVEKKVPKKWRTWVPSPASLGLAFVIQMYTSLTMYVGAVIAWALGRWLPRWSDRFLVAICAGLVAGESLTGVGQALAEIDWRLLLGR